MAKRKLIDYYQQVLWGEVGGYLEHILIWWSSDSVGRFPPSVTQDLKDFIIETKDKGSILGFQEAGVVQPSTFLIH